jgi:hypothetical protein
VAGYKNRTLTIEFPDLSDEDDPVWVKIRNPKILTTDFFDSTEDLPVAPSTEGMDEPTRVSTLRAHTKALTAAQMQQSREVMSRIIVDGHVYDANDDSDAPAVLTMPLTVETVAKLPVEIVTKISEAMSGATNPT